MEERIIKTHGLGRYPVMFGAVIMVFGLLLSLNIIALRGHRDEDVFRVLGIVFMCLSLIPLLYGFSLLLRKKGLRLSPTGFHDPQMFRNEIPWTGLVSVSNGLSNNGREEAIRLILHPEAYKAAKVNWLAKAVMADPVNGIGYTAKMIDEPLEVFGNEIVDYANKVLAQQKYMEH